MIPSRPHAPRLTRSPTTGARRKRPPILAPRREPSHDRRRAPPLHAVAAVPALADGRVHPRHAVHRRRHGFDRHAEIPDAGFDTQTARHPYPGARAGAPRGTPALWRTTAARRSARTDEA